MRAGRRLPLVALAVLVALSTEAAVIDPTSHGARGDGRTDDLPALRRAVAAAAPGDTLDGQGRVYLVRGGLRIDRPLTLVRLNLRQDLADDGREGPPSLRTLMFRSGPGEPPLEVHLREVHVHRGTHARHGRPGDAAGIWLDRVVRSSLTDVSVTGHGRGMGVAIIEADGLQADRLRVVDMEWAPCAGRPGIDRTAAARGWNRVLVHPMQACDRDEAAAERIQEPLTGVVVLRSRDVVFRALDVHRLHARFADGSTAPWQTDGLTVGSGQRDGAGRAAAGAVRIDDAAISSVWEGIDLTGAPLEDVTVRRARVSDVHAIGIKVANGTRRVRVEDSLVERAGLAGYAIGGLAAPLPGVRASGDVHIVRSRAVDTGAGGLWKEQVGRVAGFRVMRSGYSDPDGIVLESAQAVAGVGAAMDFGLLLECEGSASYPGFVSQGHGIAATRTEAGACRHPN